MNTISGTLASIKLRTYKQLKKKQLTKFIKARKARNKAATSDMVAARYHKYTGKDRNVMKNILRKGSIIKYKLWDGTTREGKVLAIEKYKYVVKIENVPADGWQGDIRINSIVECSGEPYSMLKDERLNKDFNEN